MSILDPSTRNPESYRKNIQSKLLLHDLSTHPRVQGSVDRTVPFTFIVTTTLREDPRFVTRKYKRVQRYPTNPTGRPVIHQKCPFSNDFTIVITLRWVGERDSSSRTHSVHYLTQHLRGPWSYSMILNLPHFGLPQHGRYEHEFGGLPFTYVVDTTHSRYTRSR